MFPRILSVAALLLTAGCATAPRTTYYTDGSGDYYYGGASADVIIDGGGGYYGHSGYGGYASPWGWNGGFGYGYGGHSYGYGYGYGGYGYGYSPWWGIGAYGPGWGWHYPHASTRRDRDPDIRFRQGGTGRSDAPIAPAARNSKDGNANTAYGRQPAAVNAARNGLPSSRYAPSNRASSADYSRSPLSGIGPRVAREAMPAPRSTGRQQTSSRAGAAPTPARSAPVYRAAPMNRAASPAPAPSRARSDKRE